MNAIGLIETIGYIAAIEASDACVKSANINIVSLDKVGAGIVTLTICGDVGAVKAAIEAGEIAASRIGTLRSSHVIPRIHKEVEEALFKKEEAEELEDSQQLEDNSDEMEENSEEVEESSDKIEETLENMENEITEEVSEKLDIDEENSSKEDIEFDKEDLSKYSVKELKAIAKKLDSSITYKELNVLKKDDLMNLVIKLSGEDK